MGATSRRENVERVLSALKTCLAGGK
jgi:hypothetical protein